MLWIARGILLALPLLCLPAAAVAQGANRALAEQLFRTGQELMRSGHYAEACPKFAESQRLDPGTGTLLNLAVCHEREGMLASAWAEYNDVVTLARRDQRTDRVDYAQQRLTALEPLLPRLTIEFAPGADLPGIEIRLDGQLLGRASLGVAAPMNPGIHRVVATAPGKRPWQSIAEITAAEGNQRPIAPVLRVPILEPLPASSAKSEVKPATTDSPPEARARSSSRGTQRVGAYVLGAAGMVGIGVGSFFGLRAISKNSQSNDQGCVENVCPPDAAETRNQARTAGNVSTVAFIAGGAALAAGTVLYLTLPGSSAEKPTASARATITVVPGVSTLGFVSTW